MYIRTITIVIYFMDRFSIFVKPLFPTQPGVFCIQPCILFILCICGVLYIPLCHTHTIHSFESFETKQENISWRMFSKKFLFISFPNHLILWYNFMLLQFISKRKPSIQEKIEQSIVFSFWTYFIKYPCWCAPVLWVVFSKHKDLIQCWHQFYRK